MAPNASKSTAATARVSYQRPLALRMLLQAAAASAAMPPDQLGAFCCWTASDPMDVCNTCLPSAVSGPGTYCGQARGPCEQSLGTWCGQENQTIKVALTTTRPVRDHNVWEAPNKREDLNAQAPTTTKRIHDQKVSEAPESREDLNTKAPTTTKRVHDQTVSEAPESREDLNTQVNVTTVVEHLAADSHNLSKASAKLKGTVSALAKESNASEQAAAGKKPPRARNDSAPPRKREFPGTKVLFTPNVDAVKQHGRLRVKGNKIVGEHGLPVRLRGMSMFWSQWMGQFWNPETVRWLKEDWRVSFIRAAMGVEEGGYLDDPGAEKAKLQAVVDTCIEEGIYVVIDWHDYHAEEHEDQARDFFSEMAQKYGDKPNVLFETYNEPEQISWSTAIKPYHEEVVKAIRRHSDNIIILGTRTWSQDVEVASLDPVKGKNLAYAIHFYAASMGAELRSKVSAALHNGAAIFATEWGTCEYTGDGRLDLEETQIWLDFFEKNHISDSNWGVSDKEESCSPLRGGASWSGGWSDGDLTESGRFVRNSIRSYNSDEPLLSSGLPENSSTGEYEHIILKAHSMMRGSTGTPNGGDGWQASVAAIAMGSLAAATLLALALAARRQARRRPGDFLAVESQFLDVPAGADALALLR